MTQASEFETSYASFGLKRSYHQLRHAMQRRQFSDLSMAELYKSVQLANQRMEDVYGKPIEGLDILEIGPGQGMTRAYYFGLKNKISALDTDVIARGFDLSAYGQMVKKNGLGRALKSFGRELVIGRKDRNAWADTIGADQLSAPDNLYGDICREVPKENAFDMVMSWSVFEHLPEPSAAVDNIMNALRPGGIFYISLHLYTCNDGHHDIRSFTGNSEALPLWAHLRPSKQDLVIESSYLNKWRLAQYRELFSEKVPGYVEILEKYEHPEVYGPALQGELREELAGYDEDELLTVNVVYIGQKPKSLPA